MVFPVTEKCRPFLLKQGQQQVSVANGSLALEVLFSNINPDVENLHTIKQHEKISCIVLPCHFVCFFPVLLFSICATGAASESGGSGDMPCRTLTARELQT